jgi:hypothetical protein
VSSLATACRHCTSRAADVMRKRRQREDRRQQLLQTYEVDVILEKCWLLEINPEDSVEYTTVREKIEIDLGAPPVLKTIESNSTISKLHRQGMRMHDKQRQQAQERLVQVDAA